MPGRRLRLRTFQRHGKMCAASGGSLCAKGKACGVDYTGAKFLRADLTPSFRASRSAAQARHGTQLCPKRGSKSPAPLRYARVWNDGLKIGLTIIQPHQTLYQFETCPHEET